MTDLALSTMYFQRWLDRSNLAPFFEQGAKMGFRAFELGHVLSGDAVESAVGAARQVVAVHHPCPSDGYDPRYSLTSLDRAGRAEACAAVRRSFNTARRLGAGSVVLHLGALEDDNAESLRRLEFELEARYRAGLRETAAYKQTLEHLCQLLAEREPQHLEAALEALHGLTREAAESGLRIGLETGCHPRELPSTAGMHRLLRELSQPNVGAWLDTGHVGAQANLGTAGGFAEWFGTIGDRWCGAHLHDLVGLRDHLVPGMGSLDFPDILSRLPSGIVLTCEIDWYFSPEEVRAGLDRLRGYLSR